MSAASLDRVRGVRSVPAGQPGRARPAATRPAVRVWVDPLADYHVLLALTGLLLAIGLAVILTASSAVSYATSGSAFAIEIHQVMWVALGLPLFAVATRLPPGTFRRFSWPLVLVSGAGLLLVLVPGIGHAVSGARRWIGPGSLEVQPSELAKLALVVWGADLLARKARLLDRVRHLLVPLVPVLVAFAGLVVLEPDLGTTIVLVVIVFGLLWAAGAPVRVFTLLVAGAGAAVGLLAVAAPYRLARLASFTDPFAHASGSGYQAVQGIYALSSGGLFGVGLGASRAQWAWLPNAHTDFIFAIIGEELGLVGTLLVVSLFGLLAVVGFRIASRTVDPFSHFAAVAITVWLCSQALVNMGAVVGLLPITGIPLPLISFGGSSLLPELAALGMLASFARREPEAAARLARSGPSRLARTFPRLAHRVSVPRPARTPSSPRARAAQPGGPERPQRPVRAPSAAARQSARGPRTSGERGRTRRPVPR